MTAEFWMGLAIGSVGPWVFMVVVFCAAGKGTKKSHEYNTRTVELMDERNTLDARKVDALWAISKKLKAEGRAE